MDVSKLNGISFKNDSEAVEALKMLYVEDIKEYMRQCGNDNQFPFDADNQWICLIDCVQEAGGVGEGYFLQDMWGAREIYRSNVKHVYDIGSRIDGYIAHLLAMEVNVTLLDIRPFPHNVEGINFIQADAMNLNSIPDNFMETVSALCSLEHFGLGRYTDPIDYNGWKKALHAIKRKMKVGGNFYLSVPVGRHDKVVFNAHRVFHPVTIAREMLPEVSLQEFSFIGGWRINTCLSGNVKLEDLNEVAKILPDIKNNGVMGLFKFTKNLMSPPPRCVKLMIIVTIWLIFINEVKKWHTL